MTETKNKLSYIALVYLTILRLKSDSLKVVASSQLTIFYSFLEIVNPPEMLTTLKNGI